MAAASVPPLTISSQLTVCRSITGLYLLLWIGFHLTFLRDDYADWLEVFETGEFLFTGIAETATILELLATLPSREAGNEAVFHFRVYCALFGAGTFVLYSRLAVLAGNTLSDWCFPC